MDLTRLMWLDQASWSKQQWSRCKATLWKKTAALSIWAAYLLIRLNQTGNKCGEKQWIYQLHFQVDLCCFQGCDQHSDKEHGLGPGKVQNQGELCLPWLDLVPWGGKGESWASLLIENIKTWSKILSSKSNFKGSCKRRSWPLGAHLGQIPYQLQV